MSPSDTLLVQQERETLRVFVSHAAADREPARKGLNALARNPSLRVFTTRMLSAGEDWQGRLREELTRSDVFVVVLSRNALESSFVLQEIGAAWALDKRVVVIALDRNQPLPLRLDLSPDVVVSVDDLTRLDSLLEQSGRPSRDTASE